ncbi:AmmeMemoRadiSam system radical SAM enzyme [Thermoplasma sp.]|uniref:AmmeMemoRadiSam system radical SAM enzyme n=1 Tax=Thermoplasma sp. TaxID=1973142 RepID=UPI00262BC249|nr:AmmeMemoRadiSam system radical SAM enzyme [Thermoplasma sp.]
MPLEQAVINRPVKATLYRKIDDMVECTACSRYCKLKEGKTGFCGVRKNIDGDLYLLVYGIPAAINVDPIEKKPVLHMFPGSMIYSLSTVGCSFACQYCQNYDISQRRTITGYHYEPQQIVEEAISMGCRGIAYTYNEPSIFMEYAHDIGVIARRKGLINIFVTNGFETPEAVDYARDFLDAATVDFKGNASDAFYRKYISVPSAEPIFRTIENLKAAGIHVEITDLVVPEVGDNLDDARLMLKRIMDIIGEYVPISFLRFHPDYMMMNLPETPVETLKKHRDLAVSMGFKYVYIGNVPGYYENTYCPNCGNLLIERFIFSSKVVGLDKNGRCKKCGFDPHIPLNSDRTSDYIF